MKKTVGLVVLLATATALIAACGSDSSKSEDGASAVEGSQTAVAGTSKRGAAIKVMSSRYGKVLFDANGRALYLFTRDRTSRSRCYGKCASAWPPFLTGAKPRAGAGASAKLLGTTKRSNGKTQVTYRGHPLYYYKGDRKPGQILCQGVAEFGGTWLVVTPGGRAVR
jgi:predicted lipoprotein with Yx(FWY)xxD motif